MLGMAARRYLGAWIRAPPTWAGAGTSVQVLTPETPGHTAITAEGWSIRAVADDYPLDTCCFGIIRRQASVYRGRAVAFALLREVSVAQGSALSRVIAVGLRVAYRRR